MIADRKDAVEYLDSLIGSGIRPGLDRMERLLDCDSHPETSVPAVLVAGTNGKGSTAALLSSIAHQAGCRVGLYTSPHLVNLEERWRIAEVPVDVATFVDAVRRLRKCGEKAGLTPTYFEALTLLAFFMFEASGCSLSILEVGMGGRLDATNVVDPLLSVITPIDFDHQEWLGDSIEQIAFEKLGIARANRPLLVAPQDSGAMDEIRFRCSELECELHEVSREVVISSFETGLDHSFARIETPAGEYDLRTRLVGTHQAQNLATAVRAAEILAGSFDRIGREEIIRGCGEAIWRGRLEIYRLGERLVVVDGAHNPAGSRSAAQFVEEFVPGPRALVFGVLDDKDANSMLEPLFGHFDSVILTTPDSDRGRRAETLVEIAERHGATRAVVIGKDTEAIAAGLRIDGVRSIVVCGSLYLAGTAVRLLDQMASPSE